MNSGKIEVGMLVRIIPGHMSMTPEGTKYFGHVGVVLCAYTSLEFPNIPHWDIDGANPQYLAFPDFCLQPIPPPEEADDEHFVDWCKTLGRGVKVT